MKKKYLWFILVALVAGFAAWGPIVSNVEQAKYDVVESHGAIEIRDYAPMIVAETEVKGERGSAINQGFRIIADYIFGNNISAQKVEMTTPVTQQASEKIAMTAPVIQSGEGKSWVVRFVMPSSYTMETLPKPNNESVLLKAFGKSRYAVIRFSGMAGTESLEKHTAKLESFIKEHQLNLISDPTYAFFNPPWTLPFLRRNEVMIQLED